MMIQIHLIYTDYSTISIVVYQTLLKYIMIIYDLLIRIYFIEKQDMFMKIYVDLLKL